MSNGDTAKHLNNAKEENKHGYSSKATLLPHNINFILYDGYLK